MGLGFISKYTMVQLNYGVSLKRWLDTMLAGTNRQRQGNKSQTQGELAENRDKMAGQIRQGGVRVHLKVHNGPLIQLQVQN